MRNNPMMLMGAAALLVVGGAAFQAQATMGGGTDFSARVKSYSLIEKASCNGRGLFCQAGSDPIASDSSTPVLVQILGHQSGDLLSVQQSSPPAYDRWRPFRVENLHIGSA